MSYDDDKDWVWKYVPPEQHHSGYDEGYYYHFCNKCGERTEHDDGGCVECDCPEQ